MKVNAINMILFYWHAKEFGIRKRKVIIYIFVKQHLAMENKDTLTSSKKPTNPL